VEEEGGVGDVPARAHLAERHHLVAHGDDLLAAAAVGAILLDEVRDGLLILLGLLPIVGADVVTEYRGERALDALRDASAPMARVRRAGTPLDVTAATLVPGDVVLLRGGDVVPADLRLSRTDRLLVDRSVLTGESVPEPGQAEPDPGDALLADRRSIAYAGTSVVGGRGEGLVVAIGAATEVGRIAGKLSGRMERRSPLQHELDRALDEIADQALARGTGARGLRAILEEVLLNTMYDLPSRSDIGRVVIDERVVAERMNPTLVPFHELDEEPRERSA